MRGAQNMLNYWRHLTANKTLMASLFAVVVVLLGAATLLYQHNVAQAASCRDNDIIRCGVTSRQDFENKVNQNQPDDLKAIMGHYAINADTVATKAVNGVAYKDGTIRVNGKVVATDAWSLGRNKQSFSSPVKIGSKTYHKSMNSKIFQGNSIDVLVVMDKGVFKYGILKACGNPTKGKPKLPPKPPTQPKPPVFECVDLKAIRVRSEEDDATQRAYRFTVEHRALNGAVLRDTDFDFGNGETQKGVKPSNNTTSSRTVIYDEPGTFTITTTLHFTVNGQVKNVTDEDCQAKVTVPKPNEIIVCREGEIITIPENEKLPTDLPEDSPECQPKPPVKEVPPAEIPSTGPAEVMGGVVGLSSLAGAGYYFRTSRRNLLDSILKK